MCSLKTNFGMQGIQTNFEKNNKKKKPKKNHQKPTGVGMFHLIEFNHKCIGR